jgi:vitellogenic carboxypeptidase-like protein
MTGFKLYMNLLSTVSPQEYKNYVKYVTSEEVRKQIHVGDQPFAFGRSSLTVMDYLKEDICQSAKPKLERLLAADYKVLIYSSQLDIIVPHTGIQRFLNSMKWQGAKIFSRSPKRIWKVNGEIAGYTKFARNLAYVFIRNAGHIAAHDQPLWTFDMINRFTGEKPF